MTSGGACLFFNSFGEKKKKLVYNISNTSETKSPVRHVRGGCPFGRTIQNGHML